ncbi:hypothetical protein ILUMI_04584, partial [Ignelater luminosus]
FFFQAYHRPQSASVQVAKIIAVTVVVVSVVLGGFLLASAYVTANASCRQLEQELQLLTETADRLQPLQPEALIQEEPKQQADNSIQAEESSRHVKEVQDNNVSQDSDSVDNSSDSESSNESEEEERVTPIHIKLPLQLDFDDLAGAIIDKNQRSKMNCIVEKKRAEEVVDHQPKTVRLPFGVNLTTDPRYEHVTGERMIILCESGSLQRHTQPQPQPQPQPEEQEETVMIQPVVIPIGPINPFQTHMPQQMRPSVQQQAMPMPHPMETLRPPMPGPVMSQTSSQSAPVAPNPFIQHIAQQIINQRIRMEMQRAHEEAQRAAQEEASQREEVSNEVPQAEIEHRRIPGAEVVMAQRIPIPEEILRQINRLPNHEVIVSVSEQEPEEAPQELRIIQHPRQSAQEMNGRQTYARGLPVHIPVPMMQQQEMPQEHQEHVAAATSEELRPHYVQPRSVRSVDALLPKSQKRVKRCSCDCAC